MRLRHRDISKLAVAIVIFSFVSALILEYVWKLEPCPLCIVQRFWLVLVGLFAGLALFLGTTDRKRQVWIGLAMLSAAAGAAFAIRQLWLQSLPPDQLGGSCFIGFGSQTFERMSYLEFLSIILKGTADCAQVQWRFLGLSIPGWSLVGFVLVFVLLSGHFSRRFADD